jgi:hypothetical protein
MSHRARPSLFDIIFVIWVIVVPVSFGSRLINSDGDVARHIRLGEVILDQGALPRVDFFSHTMGGRPFIAFEWGSEVVYALAYRAAGLAGVVVLAGLVLALTYALVARFLIRRGGDPLLAFRQHGAAVLSAATGWPAPTSSPCWRWSLLGCSSVAAAVPCGPTSRSSWCGPNLHGGFFYGASPWRSMRPVSCSSRGSPEARRERSGSRAPATTGPLSALASWRAW